MLKEIMNKDSYSIYKTLKKDIKKNKKKLLKLCKKYTETEDDNLLIDIEFYSNQLVDDLQDKTLLLCAYNYEEE